MIGGENDGAGEGTVLYPYRFDLTGLSLRDLVALPSPVPPG